MALDYLDVARLATSGPTVGIPYLVVNQDLALIVAASSADVVFAVPGVRVGDRVRCECAALEAGLGISMAWVNATDQVTVRFLNATIGGINPAAHDYKFRVLR